jgi:hypothetical protein
MPWSIASYNGTPSGNSLINGINIAEGCNASGINDAIRQMMADLAVPQFAGLVGIGRAPDAWGSLYNAICVGQGASLMSQSTAPNVQLTCNTYFDGTVHKLITANYGVLYEQSAPNGFHAWHTAATGAAGSIATYNERARITNAGALCLGATGPLGSELFYVNGSARFGTFVTVSNGNYSAPGIGLNGDAGGGASLTLTGFGSTFSAFSAGSGSSTRYTINAGSGGLYCDQNTSSWVGISDETTKTDLAPLTDALAKVGTLRALTGRYIWEDEGARHPFLIAQDVQAVLPEAVTVYHTDDENSPWKDKLGLGYTDVIPLLVAAFHDQIAINASQEARIASLETRLSALEAKVA